MILQKLVDYYDRMNAFSDEDAMPNFGFSRERISFELVIDPATNKSTLNDLRTPIQLSSKKEVLEARWMTVPYRGDRSSNIKSNFLWDNTGYVFGRSEKPAIETKKHGDFVELHRNLLLLAPDKGLEAVVRFFEQWNPDEYASFPLAKDAVEQSRNIVFRLKNERHYVHQSAVLQNAWMTYFKTGLEKAPGIDLVDGKAAQIAATHFLIGGIRGAQPTGASLSSFNDTAYTSYGMKSAFNSPVSVENVFKYTTSLKELLSYRKRKVAIGDSTTVFWADRSAMLEQLAVDIFSEGPPPRVDSDPEDLQRAEQVRLFLTELRDGHSQGEAIGRDSDVGFYILGLSAPALSRISVRFWVDTTVGEMRERLARHLRDMELFDSNENNPPLIIYRIVEATGRATMSGGRFQGYEADSVSPLLAGTIARAVLTGGPYPETLLGTMIKRLRADRCFTHPRLASIKGYLVRNKKKEISVSLNTEHPSPAYHCGRLLCLLDYIQGQAIGNVNAGMVKKFYTVASSQPFAIFGRLIALTTKAHLPKLDTEERPGFTQYCERLLRQIMSKIGDHFPRILSLDEQGEFALGFYNEKEELPDTPPRYFSTTALGEQVRSRAEVTVADSLHALGINYEYERPLNVPGHRLMKPDFTVIGETDRDTVFIEYLGMTDSADYMARWNAKLVAYKAAGILLDSEGGGPSGRLITFSGSKTSGINSAEIRETLKKTFGLN